MQIDSGNPNLYDVFNSGVLQSQWSIGSFSAVDVTMNGTSGTLHIGDTLVGVPTTITNTGHADVYIGKAGSVQGIHGSVVVNPSNSGNAYLFVDDSTDPSGRTVSMYDGALYGFAPAPIYWRPTSSATGGVTYLDVLGGSGFNTFNVYGTSNFYYYTFLDSGTGGASVNVQSTSASGGGVIGLYVYNEGGQDSVTIGSTGTLANINGGVDVSGPGSTYLHLYDYNDPSPKTANMSEAEITGLAPANIYWSPSPTSTSGVTYLDVLGGTAFNVFNVYSTSYLYLYTFLQTGTGGAMVNVQSTSASGAGFSDGLYVFNNGGQDYVTIGSTGTLANIQGAVDVYGSGSTYLCVDDRGDTSSKTASMYNGEINGLAPANIYWTPSSSSSGGVTFLDVLGGSAFNTFNVYGSSNFYYYSYVQTGTGGASVNLQSTSGRFYVNNNGGQDYVTIGSSGTLASIQGAVDVFGNGGTSLYVYDYNDLSSKTASIYDGEISGLAPANIYWTPSSSSSGGVTYLDMLGGYGTNSFVVQATPSIPVTLNGNSAGSNTLTGPNTTNNWDITSADSGTLNSKVRFSAMQNLIGGSGVDFFKIFPMGTEGSINGGGAPAGQGDWLDYSPFTTAVVVNLAIGSATNVNGGAAGAVMAIQDVHGGNGGDTLIGNSLGNILIGGTGVDSMGGSGRSLLIGDQGADQITGGSGGSASGGDILIGGTTIWDSDTNRNFRALMSILAEWQSGNSYATRVSHLRLGGGLNGSNKLIWSIDPLFGGTVMDDWTTNVLTAATAGFGTPAVDWFFTGVFDRAVNTETGEAHNNGTF